VVGAEFVDDTTLVVVDRIEGLTIAVLGGEAVRIERRGAGPGEYETLASVVRHAAGDGLSFYDVRLGRLLTWWPDRAGDSVDQLSTLSLAHVPLGSDPFWRNDKALLTLEQPLDRDADSAAVIEIDLERRQRTRLFPVGAKHYMESSVVSGGRRATKYVPVPHAPRDFVAPHVWGDVVVLSAGDRAIRVMSPTGDIRRAATIAVDPPSLDSDALGEMRSGLEREGIEVEGATLPTEHPPFIGLTTSRAGASLVGLVDSGGIAVYIWFDEGLVEQARFSLPIDHQVEAFNPPLVLSFRDDEAGVAIPHLWCVVPATSTEDTRPHGPCAASGER
jgi:hypothetical protein